MRCAPPGALYGPPRAPDLPILQQQFGMVGSGRGEVGGQGLGLRCQNCCVTPVAGHGGAAPLIEDHAAMVTDSLGRNDPALGRLFKGPPRRLPSLRARLLVEQPLDHPMAARTQYNGALG